LKVAVIARSEATTQSTSPLANSARVTPIEPAAPPTFAMMTGCRKIARIFSARNRASVSVAPPGRNDTIMVTARAGYSPAGAMPPYPSQIEAAIDPANQRASTPSPPPIRCLKRVPDARGTQPVLAG
jgi:hypothetical protein